MEPVIFEPQKKIRLSRSTYKVNSYIDFKPYKETFKQFRYYMIRFLKDIHDPRYVGNLYNINRPKGNPQIKLGQSDKLHFGTPTCKQVTYKCRIQSQCTQLRKEAFKLDSMYKSAHEKFLRAIDHMEFHPTLGRPKKKPEVRLKRQTQKGLKRVQILKQIKKMTRQDIEMLREIDRWLSTQYNQTNGLKRNKRFGLATWVLGWGLYKTYSTIKHIKDNIRTLQEQNLLQQDQIIELSHYLNITYGHVSSNRYAMTNLQVRLAEINKTSIATLSDIKFVKYTVAIINDIRIHLAKLTLGIMTLDQNVNAVYEYLRVLSTRQVNPLIIPPDTLRKVLAKVKKDMNRNPRLKLPKDPNPNIWNYYTIMKITTMVMDDFLLILLTIPLTDQSLEMDLYKIYNLPTLHPKLKIEFIYQMEGEYLVISKSRLYAAIPTAREIRICETTEGYLCLMNQMLYPIEKLEWCAYALFAQDQNKIRQYYSINTQKWDVNRAQILDGYLWAVSSLKKEKMQVRCLLDTHVVDIKPPLTTIYVGNGCEAYSNNLYIPAKSELTSRDDTVVRHNYFQQFNEKYQNLTKYSLIEDLGIEKLTNKEIENLPDRLAALPTLRFNDLKSRLVEIKKPLHIHSNTVAMLLLIGGIILTPCLAYILWRIYKVHYKLRGFKPVVQMFSDKKSETPNISTAMTNRLHALETRLTSLLSSIATPGTEFASPSTSCGPEPPPRRDSLPMVELNVTQQMMQETVKDMDIESSKFRHYKKYLQNRAIDAEKKTSK